MSTLSSIESSDLNLTDVFKDFYSVPDFQREYVWKTENVEKLMLDTFNEFYDENGHIISNSSEYFIGSIVTCPDESGNNIFELIDGQQRLTTSYLVLCVIRDMLRTFDDIGTQVLDNQISYFYQDDNGDDVSRERLTLQYEDSDNVLVKIVKGTMSIKEVKDISSSTISVKNIVNAYETIQSFLLTNLVIESNEELSEKEVRETSRSRLRQFHATFTKRIKLIRIVTPNLTHALKIFETINDRGVGLNAMDLLKNLLFIKTNDEKYPTLKKRWKVLIDTLDRSGEKALRFLRYYIMANYDLDSSKPLREDEIYNWFVNNSTKVGIDSQPLVFVDRLVASSKAYANFLQKKNVNDTPNRYLANISTLGGSVRQHYILLLAGQHLSTEVFIELCRHLENLFFSYIVTRETTKIFERNFGRWASTLRKVDADDIDALHSFIEEYFIPDMKARSDRFDFAFDNLRLSSIQKYRMKYILAKFAQFVEESAWENPKDAQLDQYLQSTVHIEHILPDTPTSEQRKQFDKPDDYDDYKERLGNLTLLPRGANTVASNGSYAEKAKVYSSSAARYILTQSLVTKPNLGSKNTRFNKAVSMLEQFDKWESKSIENRQKMLKKIAREIWYADVDIE